MNGWSKRSILEAIVLGVVAVIAGAVIVSRWEPAENTNVTTVALGATGSGVKPPMARQVMQSSLAGTWYSADSNALRAEIAGYFKEAQTEPRRDVVALILPHAGYAYSGRTAAAAVKSLGRDYTRVVILGPTHYLPMEETFSVLRATHYQTPLGEVPLDVEFIGRLLAHPLFQDIPAAHRQEHSVQIEVPLLQYKLGDFKLVPIVAGQCSADTVVQAGRILAGMIDPNTLVVASSDFTHYGPRYEYVPFTENVPEGLRKLDMDAFAFIAAKDPRGLLEYRRRTGTTICGCVPIAVLLAMLPGDAEAQMIKYATSGEMTNDYANSVSYLSVAFHGTWPRVQETQTQAVAGALTQEDKKSLLSLARATIGFGLEKQRVPQPADVGFTPGEATSTPRAAFVTLKENGQLRGCIGDIFPQRPLYKSVIGNAINAAFADPRFAPVRKDELARIRVEISALTPPSPVASWRDIRIGTDGMVMNKGGRSAVFLPQVAPEQGWDLETTLANLSMKAGLPADAWKEGATFQVFQAEVFGEEE
jgi:AmmeMemoRadiSam system protein B/AmmeMemoRadiSam system protein A